MNRTLLLKLGFFLISIACIFVLEKREIPQSLQFLNRGFRGGRLVSLQCGYEATGIMLVECTHEGTVPDKLLPLEFSFDDPGIYALCQWLDIHVISHLHCFKRKSIIISYYALIFFLIAAGFLLFVYGAILLFGRNKLWVIIPSGLALVVLSLFILDVYITAYFITAFSPLLLYLFTKFRTVQTNTFFISLLLFSVLCGIANMIRVHSGTGMFLFTLPLLFGIRRKWFIRIGILGLMGLSMALPSKAFSVFMKQRKLQLQQTQIRLPEEGVDHHLVWHSLYLGLAFCENPYEIVWDDNFLFKQIYKEKNIRTSLEFVSIEYENAVKEKYMTLLKNDRIFIFKTLLFKALYAGIFLILIGSLSFLFFFNGRIQTNTLFLISFLLPISFYTIPAILVWPFPMYFLGSIASLWYLMLILFLPIKEDSNPIV